MKDSNPAAELLRHWLPSILYAGCYLYLDYHAIDHPVFAEHILDRVLAEPAGFITLVVLPAASYLYIRWLSRQFFTTAGTALSARSWLLIDVLPWVLALLMCRVDRPLTAYTLIAGTAWALGQLLWRIGGRARLEGTRLTQTQEYIAVLFFISGFSALIYQLVWQRTLSAAIRMDSESVTIIISVFMTGLGIGALLGSSLVRFEKILLRLFLAAEIGIGVFGFFSIPVTQFLLQHLPIETRAGLVILSYLLFAVPTMFMGTTLPLLVGHLDISYNNLGRSTGLLYAANTLGSALAALMTVSVIFVLTGQHGATTIAACFNLTTAVLLFLSLSRLERTAIPPAPGFRHDELPAPIGPCILSASVGFVALSGEILYYRLLGFTSGGLPPVFGWLLAAYLSGIAAGSYRVKRLFERPGGSFNLTGFVYGAGLIILLTPAALGLMSAMSGRPFALMGGLVLCGLFGFLTGGILPYLCNRTAAGSGGRQKAMALVYAFNILGAALGPLVTGYLLLEYLSATGVAMLLAIALLVIGYFLHGGRRPVRVVAVTLFLLICLDPLIAKHYLERLQQQTLKPVPFKTVVEDRVAIITVIPDDNGDKVYGGGAYDGRLNIDPLVDSNGIQRAFYTACLHPNPVKVLEIGLSSGAWARVMLSNKMISSLTSIEINHGYRKVIAGFPLVRNIMHNPRFRPEFDDGRRWLRLHPGEKYDLIVMNTTFHWRSNTSNLLSREYFHLVKRHLYSRGVFYFNATGSIEAGYTAAAVFKHVIRFRNFYAASDAGFDMTTAQKRANLIQFTDGTGKSYFLQSNALKQLMNSLANRPQQDIGTNLRRDPRFRVITDDNMLVEYKLGIFH